MTEHNNELASLSEVWRHLPTLRLGQLLALVPDLASESESPAGGLARHLDELRSGRQADESSPERASEQHQLTCLLLQIAESDSSIDLMELIRRVGELCDRHTDQHITIIDDAELEFVFRLELARLERKAGDTLACAATDEMLASV